MIKNADCVTRSKLSKICSKVKYIETYSHAQSNILLIGSDQKKLIGEQSDLFKECPIQVASFMPLLRLFLNFSSTCWLRSWRSELGAKYFPDWNAFPLFPLFWSVWSVAVSFVVLLFAPFAIDISLRGFLASFLSNNSSLLFPDWSVWSLVSPVKSSKLKTSRFDLMLLSHSLLYEPRSVWFLDSESPAGTSYLQSKSSHCYFG